MRYAALILSLVACQANDTRVTDVPPAQAQHALSDEELAKSALQILGANIPGARGTCGNCHQLGSQQVQYWKGITDNARTHCMRFKDGDVTQSAGEIVECLRVDHGNPNSPFSTYAMGIYAADAASLHQTFLDAYPADAAYAEAQYAIFMQSAAMPRAGYEPPSSEELALVLEWFAKGLPRLHETLGEPPPPTSCDELFSPALGDYVHSVELTNWQAVNAERGLSMLGCDGAVTPLDCLASFPKAADVDYATSWEHGDAHTRVLRELPFDTIYWERSSPDGRFVSNGGSPSHISDLLTGRDITVTAAYDPGFFPDNSAWVFQGTPIGTAMCPMSTLTAQPARIDFSNSPECNNVALPLYQHLARGLDGGDYFAVNGQWTGDSGGNNLGPVSDPPGTFTVQSNIVLFPILNDGTHWVQAPSVTIPASWEGDSVMSPAAGLLASRMTGTNAVQHGYSLRRLTLTKTDSGYSAEAPVVGRVCVRGGKPAFSYDERFLTMHHYVDAADYAEMGYASPSDPAFVPYLQNGAANIWVVDLLTGARRRATNMKEGQYALYPHFRSDGWLYFLVRDAHTFKDYIAASDIALRMK